jgi:RNA polymerase sigma factor (TIGR02999 family)
MERTGMPNAIIDQAGGGDPLADDELFSAAYPELRRLARARLRSSGHDALLDTTGLVHEWYLRYARAGAVRIVDRTHFMRYAGRAMRSVIVDFARRRGAVRRGADPIHVTLGGADGPRSGAEDVLRVHEALGELAAHDPRMVQVVELRYFAGLTEAEIADALGIAERTVRRVWEKARLLLAEALR